MKIMLVRYHDKENINLRVPKSVIQGVLQPLGIAYMASVLEREGYNVKIIDVLALNITKNEFEKIIKEEKPDICGVTCMTLTLNGALEALKICKKNGAITVIGGVHLSVYPKETLSYQYIDYGIAGEGEYAFLELVKAIENKKSVENIKGLIYRKNRKIIINGERIVKDIDSLPAPAYHLLPMEKYSFIVVKGKVCSMMASRGCPFRCSFCFKSPSNQIVRTRKAESVVQEIEYLKNNFNVKWITFYDDNFTLDRKFVVDFCKIMVKKKMGVAWEALTRIDRIDLEILKLMKKAGCVRLKYGVESGDERILKMMKKDLTIDQVKKVFKMTKKVGLETYAYFMIGYASETEETIKKTINLSIELEPDYVVFSVVTPCPKTDLYSFVRKKGLIKEDYWRKFTLGEVDYRLPYLVKDADKWMKKAYRRFYLRPTPILKKIKTLRSWDEFKKGVVALLGLLMFKMEQAK